QLPNLEQKPKRTPKIRKLNLGIVGLLNKNCGNTITTNTLSAMDNRIKTYQHIYKTTPANWHYDSLK
ncbi:MAG TPA: hypothetical protein PKV50_05845, partial [Prolixibacteraceae bacterium]|nr:hypothetical protein [Prolixibacteraceae bacterium]